MEQRVILGQSKISYHAFRETLREIITQVNEAVIRDEILDLYVKFAVDELYTRLRLWMLPTYKLFATGFHTKDTQTGLYVVSVNDDCQVYNLLVPIATVPLNTIIHSIESVSYGKYGMCLQNDIGFLQHVVGSENDMYLKSIFWCYYNSQVIVYNGPESIKVGTQRDAVDNNPMIPVVDGTIGFEPHRVQYGFDTDIPNTRKTTPYYLSVCRRPILPMDLNMDTSVTDMPLDFPGELTRLLLTAAQRICLEQVTGSVDPNLVQLVESQINNYIGGNNDQGNNTAAR